MRTICLAAATIIFAATIEAPALEYIPCDVRCETVTVGPAPGKASKRRSVMPRGGNYTTVATAAGMEITGSSAFIYKAKAVIDDLVASGQKPLRVKCLSYAKSHVPGSLHFRGLACDVDQSGWGKTRISRQALSLAIAKVGLRDGCEFRDWGHFDAGPHLPRARVLRNCGRAYADAVDGRTTVAAGD